MTFGKGWSPEQLAELRKLWDEGLSASQIATRIGGKSRNAIVGMSHRMGLSGRANPIKRHVAVPKMSDDERRLRHNEQQRLARAAKPKPVVQVTPRPKPRPLTKPIPAAVPPIDPSAIGKMTREQVQDCRGCRWPYGDLPNMRFCGKPGDPWCPKHRQRAYPWAAK